LLLSGSAAVLGLGHWSAVEKWHISALSAASAGLAFAARSAKFKDWVQWHYRRSDGLIALRNRLDFELPVNPSADNIAAVSRDLSKLVDEMTAQAGIIRGQALPAPKAPPG
jgi:hypothetical protein